MKKKNIIIIDLAINLTNLQVFLNIDLKKP